MKSFVGVPLPGHNAVLYAYSFTADFFSVRERQMLELIAGQAAIALDNSQLVRDARAAEQRARDHAAQMSMLHAVSQQIRTEMDEDKLLNAMAELAARTLGGSSGTIMLADAPDEYLHIRGAYNLSADVVQQTRIKVGESISGRVFVAGEPLFSNDLQHDVRLNNPVARAENFQSVICVPLSVHGETVGTLAVQRRSNDHVWTDDNINVLESIANQASVALERVRAAAEMEKGLQTVRSLLAAGSTIAFAETDDELLKSTVEETKNALGCQRVKVALREANGQFAEIIQVGFEWGKDSTDLIRADGISTDVIESGELWWRTDITEIPEEVNPILVEDGVRGAACIPLWRKEEAVGIMWLHYTEPHEFTEFDIEALPLYANLVAMAITNSRHIKNIEASTRTLSALYKASSAILLPLSREQILSVIAREVRSALGLMRVKIALFDPKTEKLLNLAQEGFDDASDAGDTFRNTGISARVIKSGEAWWNGNIQANPEGVNPKMLEDGVKAAVCLPFQIQEDSICVLWLHYDETQSFPEAEKEALYLFANQSAIAIKNARLLDEIQRRRQQYERLVANAPIGIVALDREGIVTDINPKGASIFDSVHEEIVGQHVSRFYTGQMAEARKIGRLLYETAGHVTDYNTSLSATNGEVIPIQLTATWLYAVDADITVDEPDGSVGYFIDLRELEAVRKRLELLVTASRDVAQADDMAQAMQGLAQLLVQHLRVGFCRIFILDSRAEMLTLKATFDRPNGSASHWRPQIGEEFTIVGWRAVHNILDKHGPVLLDRTIETDGPFFHELSERLPFPMKELESLLIVPIRTASHAVGLLSLGNRERTSNDPFPKEAQDLAMAIAEQTSSLIERIRLQEEATESHKLLQSFYTSSNVIVSDQPPNQVLQEIVEQVRNVVNAQGVAITIIDEFDQPSTPVTSKNYGKVIPIRPNGYSMQAFREGKQAFVEDMGQLKSTESALNEQLYEHGTRAFISVPLMLRGKSLGVLRIHFNEPRYFLKAEIDALQLFADQAALTYETSRRMDVREKLRSAAEALAATATTRGALEEIVRWAQDVFDATSTAVWAFDSNERKFLINDAVAAGIDSTIWEEFRDAEPRAGETAFEVINNGWIGVEDVNDLEVYPFMGKSTRKLLLRVGVRSFQGIALRVGSETLGVLYVNYNIHKHFSEHLREIVTSFANHAALTLKKARLLEQVQKSHEIIDSIVKSATLENLGRTLRQVVAGTCDALDADAVTLYVYDRTRGVLHNPPIMKGVNRESGVYNPKISGDVVPPTSAVMHILGRDEPYIVDNIHNDPLFKESRFAKEEQIKSFIAIPLTIVGDRVGVMFVNYRSSHRFTSEAIDNMTLYGNLAAVSIRNAQLFDNLEQQTDDFFRLYEVGKTITASLDVGETLNQIAFHAAKIFNVDEVDLGHVSISLLDDDGYADVQATYPVNRRSKIVETYGRRKVIGEVANEAKIGIVGYAMRTGSRQIVVDVKRDTIYLPTHDDIQSAVAVPIKYGGVIIGAINVEFRKSMPNLDDRVPVLDSLGAYAAIAIQNAQSFEREQQRLNEATVLHKVAEALAGTAEYQDVLYIVMTEAKQLFKMSHCNVLFWDKSRESFSRALRLTADDRLEEYQTTARSGGGYSRTIIDTKGPYTVSDALLDPNTNPANVASGYRAVFGVPLISQGEVMGVLYVRGEEPRTFSEREQDLFMAIAGQAAVALERTNYVEELKDANLRIDGQTALAWMGMFSSSYQHATRTNAVTIEDTVALIRKDLEGGFDEAGLQKRLENIERMTGKIKNVPVSPPLAREDEAESVRVNGFIRERVPRLWMQKPFSEVPTPYYQFRLDNAATIRISRQWLSQVIDLLLENAVKYMRNSSVKAITITTELLGRHAAIEITDTGPGVPPDVQEKLFKVLIPKPQGSDGLGAGLLITQTILQAHGGRIWIKETGDRGTTFQILLPVESA
ncbi:MAG TPA: GAF domain-containing protein [Caldilineaceae bacterium]|nr:GAF domain-containing protein [Caldilineaceae bacterium]